MLQIKKIHSKNDYFRANPPSGHSDAFVVSDRGGFTLVELLVAITLFAIAISVAVGGFVRALRTQRQLISLIAANSNVSLAMEQMAREMRTGKNFNCTNGARYCDELLFTDADGETVEYGLSDEGVLTRKVNDGVREHFTAEQVRVAYLHFFVPDTLPQRVTISLGVGVRDQELEGNVTNLETTVSSRAF
jgi:prepilin-type N-terminal cleavage/methylation domain-containing protein